MANVLERVPVREQDPKVRATNFEEVCYGYNKEEAMEEAQRCINCKNARCIQGCPVSINIPGFISHVKEGNIEEAYKVIGESSALPAICGRVCPQESQCESKCIRGIKGDPISIGKLERFVADYALEHDIKPAKPEKTNGHKVAVIGSGPSGLTCAGDLAKAGYDVTVDIYDKDVHKELLGSESYEMYIVFGKKSYVEQNPEITQLFINACYKGAQYLDSHDTDEIVATLKEQFSEMTNLEQVVKECKDNGLWSPDGLFTDSGVEAINKMAMDSGLIDKPVAKSDLVDDSFAKKAAGK